MEAKELLGDVKNYLDITWDDESTDKKLLGMIGRGMSSISAKIGACNFEEETPEKSLLLNYVMYDRVGELSKFWENYKQEILALQIAKKVEEYEGNEI